MEFENATAVVYAHVNKKLYFSLQNNADNLCNKFTFIAFLDIKLFIFEDQPWHCSRHFDCHNHCILALLYQQFLFQQVIFI